MLHHFCSHVLFQESLVIPAAFLIHKRKTQNFHNELMVHLKEEIPSLSAIVVDELLMKMYPEYFAFSVGTTQQMQ